MFFLTPSESHGALCFEEQGIQSGASFVESKIEYSVLYVFVGVKCLHLEVFRIGFWNLLGRFSPTFCLAALKVANNQAEKEYFDALVSHCRCLMTQLPHGVKVLSFKTYVLTFICGALRYFETRLFGYVSKA